MSHLRDLAVRRLAPLAADALRQARQGARELVRVLRVLLAPRGCVVVAYTKPHPIYTDVFERYPPGGFVFYYPATVRLLTPLDRAAWRRVALVHRDAATARGWARAVPEVVECEGRPREEFFSDPVVRHVFVESEWAGGQYLASGRVTLLRPSVPLPRRTPARDASVRRPRRGPPVLVAVGYGGMVKGFDVVVRVYEALKREAPVRLILAGTFGHNFEWYPEITAESYARADFAGIARRLHSDPNVVFRPMRRSELGPAVYQRGDVYLHLSRMDTFGYSILEAMSYALPVVATRLNAIPEMVRHGETGFLCTAEGLDMNGTTWSDRVFEQALDATRRLLADEALRAKMGEAGRRRVARAFDIEYKRRELARVYGAALGAAAPAAEGANAARPRPAGDARAYPASSG